MKRKSDDYGIRELQMVNYNGVSLKVAVDFSCSFRESTVFMGQLSSVKTRR